MSRKISARLRRDDGMTLPELLVTMFLVAMIGVLVASLFTSITRTLTRDRAANDSIGSASVAMDQLSRVLRATTDINVAGGGTQGLVGASGKSLTVYSYVDTQSDDIRPLKVTYELTAAGELRESRWKGTKSGTDTWSFPTKATSSRVIARDVVESGGTPLFTYLYLEGEGLLRTSSPTSAQRAATRAVEVNIYVQADETERAEPVQLVNTIGMPNRLQGSGSGTS